MSKIYRLTPAGRVSFETIFDSKQPKLEPKLVSALSETKRLFRLFRFCTETACFGVSIEPKQTEDQPKQTETNGNESNMKGEPARMPTERPRLEDRERKRTWPRPRL